MSDESAPPMPPSPYGPDSDTPPAGPEATTPSAPAPAWVERGRDVLRVAVLVSGVLSVLLTATLIALGALGMGTANNDLSGVNESVTWILIFGAPVLFVIAMNLLVWRTLLRPLGRLETGGRIALIAGMVVVLGGVSVAFVALLLFGGFLAGGLIGAGADF